MRQGNILKKNQIELLEMKNTIYEMKTSLDGISSRLDTEDENITELEIIAIETIQTEIHREKKSGRKQKEQRISNLWENIKWSNISAFGVP